MRNLEASLKRLNAKFPVSSRPELETCVNWAGSKHLPIHRWFRYREGYSPSLFAHFADSRSRLDPFCGCGTTLLTSSMEDVDSFGLDLNPLATFVASVKTRRYTLNEKRSFGKYVRNSAEEYRHFRPAAIPEYPLLTKLFQPEALDTLLRIKTYITHADSDRVRDLLKLAWLSVLEDSSNVFKEGNGLKYRNKLRRPGKYITISDAKWIPKYFGQDISAFVTRLWLAKCSQISSDLSLPIRQMSASEPEIRTGSCFEKKNMEFEREADLAIFSPPYANRFDYFEAFKIELWLGDFVRRPEDMAALRAKSMRNNLAAPRTIAPAWRKLSPFLDAMDEQASSVRMGIKTALGGYFEDMRKLLSNLKTAISRKGRVVVVVGNSAYASSIVPTDLLICELAAEEGYKVTAVNVARSLHVSSQQRNELRRLEPFMRESVLVFAR